MDNILATVVGGVGGAVVTQLANIIINNRKSKSDERISYNELKSQDYKTLLTSYENLYNNERVAKEEAILNTKILVEELQDIKRDMYSMKSKLLLFENTHFTIPFPMWIKDMSGIMLTVNKAYEDQFLKPLGKEAIDYIGKNDIEFWGEEIGKQYQENDHEAYMNPNSLYVGYEDLLLPSGKTTKIKVVKYIQYSGNTAVGKTGISIPNYVDKK